MIQLSKVFLKVEYPFKTKLKSILFDKAYNNGYNKLKQLADYIGHLSQLNSHSTSVVTTYCYCYEAFTVVAAIVATACMSLSQSFLLSF